MSFRELMNVGIINTIRINLHYFGLKGLFHPVILASRYLRISKLGGVVRTEDNSIGAIRLCIGYNGVIDEKTNRGTWENTGVIQFRGKVYICPGTRIINHGEVTIGANTVFNGNVSIICYENIEFGSHCLISWDCQIMDTDFHKIYTLADGKIVNPNRNFKIGNHVWIASRCTILKGASIPDNSVIACESIITKQLSQSNCIYKNDNIIRMDIQWES